MKRDNNKNMLITDAESYRNTMMLAFYGLEDRIKKSKTAADYIDLIRRTGMLAEAMANEQNARLDQKDLRPGGGIRGERRIPLLSLFRRDTTRINDFGIFPFNW